MITKQQIFDLITEYHKSHQPQEFIPGKTKIHYSGPTYDEKELIAVTDTILDFWISLGKKGEEFENNFSKYLQTKNTIITNSGSSANLIAIASLKLKSGSEVITPALTFPTTFNPILQNNLVPVLTDVNLTTYNLHPNNLEACLSDKTKLIMLPHTLGNPNNMGIIMEFANKHGLHVIEDSCDALGAKYGSAALGTIGDIGTFSFFPAHHCTMGEGGAVITNNDNLSSTIRSLRDWGRACTCPICKIILDENYQCPNRTSFKTNLLPPDYDKRYVYTNIGYNLKPTELQAALGIEQLKKLPQFLKARANNFNILYKFFENYRDYFILPTSYPDSEPAWFSFPLIINTNKFTRADIVKYLEKNNIETRLIFAGNIIRQPAYKDTKYRIVGSLYNSNIIMRNAFFIGIYPGIDKPRMNYILEKFEEFLKHV